MEVKPKPEEFNPQEQALLFSVLPHSLLQQYQPNPLQNNPFIFLSSPPRNVVYNNIVVNNNLNNNNDIVVNNTNNLHNNNNNNNVVYNGTVVNDNNNNVVVDSRVNSDDSTINDIVFIDDVSKEDEAYIKDFPSGYRFKPLDVELILYYLTNKVLKLPLPPNKIPSVDIYLHNPEDLIAKLTENSVGPFENEWYFFTPRKRKYQNGTRPNRRAGQGDRIGYWKATGADKSIEDRGAIVGFRKALVFYNGKAPSGLKTNWIMHEYRMNIPPLSKMNAEDMRLDDWVLCKLHKKLYKAARIAHDDREPQLGIVDNEFLPQDHDNYFNQYENGNSGKLMFDPAMLPRHYGDDYNSFVSTIDRAINREFKATNIG